MCVCTSVLWVGESQSQKCFLYILREFKQQVLFNAKSFVQNAGILGIYVYKNS